MSILANNLFHGKVAFVAGGTSGINLGIAKRFAAIGATVAVAGRNAEKAAAAAAAIGQDARGYSCDVRDYAATRAVMERAAAHAGQFDFVVSGAAGNFLARALDMSANAFRTVVDIDLNGTFNVFRGCYDLLNRPGASLIAITAPQAVRPMMMQIHASAAKAGVNQVVRVLAMEWGPTGVRVNGISPGPIGGTEGMARLAPTPEAEQRSKSGVPLQRWGTIAEVAECAAFLCSDGAAYINGAILDCDGGPPSIGGLN